MIDSEKNHTVIPKSKKIIILSFIVHSGLDIKGVTGTWLGLQAISLLAQLVRYQTFKSF